MNKKLIDAHIHLDHYEDNEIKTMIEGSDFLESLITVSFDLNSCKRNKQLSEMYAKVIPAFGFHPEQALPSEQQLDELHAWMTKHRHEMIAIGEVGLPYYKRVEEGISGKEFGRYSEVLEGFIKKAKEWDKPIVLHAVYDDAPLVCDLLEKHSVPRAHFHWFKGDAKTIDRMSSNGYHISVTPDVIYEEEIQQLVNVYPIEQIMIETDGPWPFEGPFDGKRTHPVMMKESLKMIARLKHQTLDEVSRCIYDNTKSFFSL
jgi:TatD DNase family protein